jgi:MYXO-CTERM domain-containing protein
MIGVAADTWDLAAVRVDLGDGEAPYAMGFTGSRQLRIYRYDNSPGSWLLAATTADGSNSAIPLSGFGAAWSHDGEVFFAANSGHGVYEVLIPTIDLTAGTVTVRRVANSAKTAKNDGTNCVGIDVPPPTTTTEPPASTTTTTTEPPATTTTTTEPPATTLAGAPEPTTSTTEEPASAGTQDSDGDGFTDREEINQLGTDPFDADDPGGGVIRQSLTAPEAERTGGSTNWWKPVTALLAAAGLLLLLAVRRRRCQHCGQRLTDRDGVLVDPDDNPDCADNPDDDHHQLKRK